MRVQFLIAFVVLVLAIFNAAAQKNITADFEDAKFLAQVRLEIRKPTGAIYDKDVANVERLDIIQKGIKSIAGIEHFKNLTRLDVRANKLTSIDVSNIPKLRYLFCSKNQLTELDVSNNYKLDWLECSDNQITKLDLSNNPLMVKVWMHNNQLTKMNLSNNPKLTELWCYKNNLTELDISNNPRLKDFRCSRNQLTELDISKNVKLSHLDCSHNLLTELDMSNNIELGSDAYYSNNKLTSVKKSPRIVYKKREPVKAKITTIDSKASRSRQEIMAVVNTRLPGLGTLYNKHLKIQSYFKGNITLEFTITPSGDVASISIESDTTGFKDFEIEIRDRVSYWKWKAIDGGNTTVTISFDFED